APSVSFHDSGSPSTSAARPIVIARLSLSIGATREAGASCSARKYASHDRPVAMPESVRKNRGLARRAGSARGSPPASAMPQANTSTTTVRVAVARFDGTPSTPIFARMAVAAAAIAEANAKTHQGSTAALLRVRGDAVVVAVRAHTLSLGSRPPVSATYL